MSKLPKEHQFIDLSDYGRPVARVIANSLKSTKCTPVDVTIAFVISGLIGVYCILKEFYWLAAFFLILKSVLDAADGELARVKETPSYTGRFLDSVSDIILNFIILRHEPDKAAADVNTGDITNADGSTDVQVTFNIVIE